MKKIITVCVLVFLGQFGNVFAVDVDIDIKDKKILKQENVQTLSDYPAPVIAAIITSATSIGIAIWSLFTSRIARVQSLKAEDASKRSEQIRTKAIDAGDEILKNFADYIVAVEGLLFLMTHLPNCDEKTLFEAIKPISTGSTNLKKAAFSNAIYLSKEILNEVESITRNESFSFENDNQDVKNKLENIRNTHSKIAKLFCDTYLKQ